MAEAHRAWRERLGSYVLGQLDAEERTATEAHLDGCAECREELRTLAPVAAILSRADPERLVHAPTPPHTLPTASGGRHVRSSVD